MPIPIVEPQTIGGAHDVQACSAICSVPSFVIKIKYKHVGALESSFARDDSLPNALPQPERRAGVWEMAALGLTGSCAGTSKRKRGREFETKTSAAKARGPSPMRVRRRRLLRRHLRSLRPFKLESTYPTRAHRQALDDATKQARGVLDDAKSNYADAKHVAANRVEYTLIRCKGPPREIVQGSKAPAEAEKRTDNTGSMLWTLFELNTRILSFSVLNLNPLRLSDLTSRWKVQNLSTRFSPTSGNIPLAITTRIMARDLLPIRILFHVTFAFVYLPIIGLGFTYGLTLMAGNVLSISDTPVYISFVKNHFDGIIALVALVGLGIFAALDILTIWRNVDQRVFLAIEIFVVVIMPLSVWPIIVACIHIIWTDWWNTLFSHHCSAATLSWFCSLINSVGWPADTTSSALVIAATTAILGLNAAFVLYICIAAFMDKLSGNVFLPIYLEDSSLSSPETGRSWYLFGAQRTPAERAAMVSHCAKYIFRKSIFRKHAFEPAGWAIFRGIIAVYACICLVVSSAYSGYTQYQLHSDIRYTPKDTMLVPQCADYERFFGYFSVTAFTANLTSFDDFSSTIIPHANPPPVLSPNESFSNPRPEVWATSGPYPPTVFDLRWTGDYSLVMWVSSALSIGFMNSTQVQLTRPLILAPFKDYTISLIFVRYSRGTAIFHSFIPDIITSVDSGSRSNTSVATFSFNNFCQQILERDLSAPSTFSSVANALSEIGGTLSFIDGLFALIFGRTIAAILFGSRIISPFGFLGIVARNRLKRLIHEQYPRMLEDIERGGMAAYISEVAIDTALMPDKTSSKSRISSSESSFVGDDAGDNIGLRCLDTGSSASYLRLPYIVEELEYSDRNTLIASQTDHK
ncbi:hypothetical protein FIBSPDRAFT_996584 [Athelia psychrophila]|uniref:Uncharacterized protein n=1 Tax=Athelia psychrophila TaxID=1759441 RepID=A0A165WUP7_9AGAM|nr:hypothetical protein FIBSPDRAFT_996584 [Fibularhizoctonia sp. CBS 109695]